MSGEEFANKIKCFTKTFTENNVHPADLLNLLIELDDLVDSLGPDELSKDYWMWVCFDAPFFYPWIYLPVTKWMSRYA